MLLKQLNLFQTLDKCEWIDNKDYIFQISFDCFNRLSSPSQKMTIFQDDELVNGILKSFIQLHKRFLLEENDNFFLPLLFISKLVCEGRNIPNMLGKCLQYDLVDFIITKCLNDSRFSVTNVFFRSDKLYYKDYTFSKFNIYRNWIYIIISCLNYSETLKINLKNKNLYKICKNLKENFLPHTYSSTSITFQYYLCLFQISIYFYHKNYEKQFLIDRFIYIQILSLLKKFKNDKRSNKKFISKAGFEILNFLSKFEENAQLIYSFKDYYHYLYKNANKFYQESIIKIFFKFSLFEKFYKCHQWKYLYEIAENFLKYKNEFLPEYKLKNLIFHINMARVSFILKKLSFEIERKSTETKLSAAICYLKNSFHTMCNSFYNENYENDLNMMLNWKKRDWLTSFDKLSICLRILCEKLLNNKNSTLYELSSNEILSKLFKILHENAVLYKSNNFISLAFAFTCFSHHVTNLSKSLLENFVENGCFQILISKFLTYNPDYLANEKNKERAKNNFGLNIYIPWLMTFIIKCKKSRIYIKENGLKKQILKRIYIFLNNSKCILSESTIISLYFIQLHLTDKQKLKKIDIKIFCILIFSLNINLSEKNDCKYFYLDSIETLKTIQFYANNTSYNNKLNEYYFIKMLPLLLKYLNNSWNDYIHYLVIKCLNSLLKYENCKKIIYENEEIFLNFKSKFKITKKLIIDKNLIKNHEFLKNELKISFKYSKNKNKNIFIIFNLFKNFLNKNYNFNNFIFTLKKIIYIFNFL